MKKLGLVFIFIFLTGLFSGLFFSTGLSYENGSYLSTLLTASLSDSSAGFSGTFFSLLFSNFILVIAAAPAVFTRFLCPLPPMVLAYKSFAIGFCSGLLFLDDPGSAFLISATKIFPQNIFIIPGFIILCTAVFFCSTYETMKKNRSHHEKKDLLIWLSVSVGLILAGCLTASLFHSVSL